MAEVRYVTLLKETGAVGAKDWSRAADWEMSVTGMEPAGLEVRLVEGHSATTGQDGHAGPWEIELPGDETALVKIAEQTQSGWVFDSLTCSRDQQQSESLNPDSSTGGQVHAELGNITVGDNITCTFRNKQTPGTVTWEKVDGSGESNLLAASEWKLVGPEGDNSTTRAIKDCVEDSLDKCTGPDKNPSAGKFSVNDLPWGKYALTETKAPAGYLKTDKTFAFTITPNADSSGAATIEVSLGPVVNEQRTGPNLPLTGGMSAIAFLIVGGGLFVAAMARAGQLQRRRAAQTE